MAEIKAVTIFRKLDSVGYKCFEASAVAAKMAGNPNIDVVHVLNQILTLQDTDVHHILNAFGINPSRLASDMTTAVSKLPRGGGGAYVDFSERTLAMMEAAWKYASLLFNSTKLRSGHLKVALVKEPSLRGYLYAVSREFEKIKPDALTDDFAKIVAKSPEEDIVSKEGDVGGGVAPGEASGATAPAQMGKQEALKKYTTDLTEKAAEGKSIRSWAAMRRYGRSSMSSCAGDRITRFLPARPAWARPRWSRGSRCGSPGAMCRRS